MKRNYDISIAKNTIRELAYYVMLNGQFIKDASFYNGKSGIALSLFEASRFLNDQTIEDCAYDLLTQSLLSQSVDISFETGMSGIGFVLEYLIQNRFIEANLDDIFHEQHENIVRTFLQYRISEMDISQLAAIWPIAIYLFFSKEERTMRRIEMIKEMELEKLCLMWERVKSDKENKEYLTHLFRRFLRVALLRNERFPGNSFHGYTSLVKDGILKRDAQLEFYISSLTHTSTGIADKELCTMLNELSIVDRKDTICLFKQPHISQHRVQENLCKKFFGSSPQGLDEILSVIVMGNGNPIRLSFGIAGLILGLIAIYQTKCHRIHDILSII